MAGRRTARRAAGAAGAVLRGRSAVITGASRGIGLACARTLHEAGARVILVARGARALQALARELGREALAVPGDLADAEAVRRVLRDVRELLDGAPDVLVNNAGHFTLAPVEHTSERDFERALQVNLAAPFAVVRNLLPDFRARGSGHIVTIGSVADRVAYPGNAAYATSKFGARALHEVVREETRGSGVRATLISPGPVDTTLWDALDPRIRAGLTPRARMLAAQAVADAVLFAVSRPDDVNIDELRLSRS